jgi:hypothetical protein
MKGERKMKRYCVRLVAIGIFSIACTVICDAQICGLSTLNGAYAFKTAGTSFGLPYVPDGSPQTWVGEAVFDGSGKGTSFNTGSIRGLIFEDGANRANFTYTVNKDCSGSLTVALPFGDVHWNMVIADNGKRILTILKDSGFVFTGEYYRQ